MGPLNGIRIIELKGLGPAPYAGMLLADLGAEVIVVERGTDPPPTSLPSEKDVLNRGKRSLVLDLSKPGAAAVLLDLVATADGLIEGFRPGVTERLGIGPTECLERNPALVFGRVTGWGQEGPLATAAGHDLNYIALAGALAAIGREDRPVPPLNLVGDYAGGSLFLVVGMLAALLEARDSGQGQVVDAAMVDGAASLMSLFCGWAAAGRWSFNRQSNLIDGAAPHYDVYRTADEKFVAIAALEPQFLTTLAQRAEIDPAVFQGLDERRNWPRIKHDLAAIFSQRTRAEWCTLLEGSDACFAPVLDLTEAPTHPHNRARDTFIEIAGVTQPAPAPRFGRTACPTPAAPVVAGADSLRLLDELGYDERRKTLLRDAGILGRPRPGKPAPGSHG